MVAKPLCPLYKNIIKPLDRARYPELRYVLLVDNTPANISNALVAPAAKNAPVYNLAGQQVGASYKGVVIKNGKKYVQK